MFDALERVLKGLKPVSRGPLPLGFDWNQFVAILLPGDGHGIRGAARRGSSEQPWRYG